MAEPTTKSEKKSGGRRLFAKGPDPRRGKGPAKGAPNAGRPPGSFKDFLAGVRANPVSQDALARAATDEHCRNFGTAWKIATEYDDDRPAEKKELSGAVTVVVRIEREGRRIVR